MNRIVMVLLVVGSATLGAFVHHAYMGQANDRPAAPDALASRAASGDRQLQALQRELVRLRAEQSRQRHVLDQVARHRVEADESGPLAGESDDAQLATPSPSAARIEAREHEMAAARIDAIQASFDVEQDDPRWAREMEGRIADVARF